MNANAKLVTIVVTSLLAGLGLGRYVFPKKKAEKQETQTEEAPKAANQ